MGQSANKKKVISQKGADISSVASALIVQTITNGDATHAPSGNAVFDALATKADGTGTANGTNTGDETNASICAIVEASNTVVADSSQYVPASDGAGALIKMKWVDIFSFLVTASNIGNYLHSLTNKATPIDADEFGLVDTADSNKEKKVTFLQSWTNYFKVKADALYQAILVSGTNIKTVNSSTLLGSGNLAVGDLLSANNLSDVNNPITSRNNLKTWDMFMTNGNQTTTQNTVQSITDLVLALPINKTFKITGQLVIGCDNTGGVKVAAAIPAGATMTLIIVGPQATTSAFIFNALTASATLSASAFCTVNATNRYIKFEGQIVMSSTAGSLQLQFASGTSTQTSTIFQLGTGIKVEQLN